MPRGPGRVEKMQVLGCLCWPVFCGWVGAKTGWKRRKEDHVATGLEM